MESAIKIKGSRGRNGIKWPESTVSATIRVIMGPSANHRPRRMRWYQDWSGGRNFRTLQRLERHPRSNSNRLVRREVLS